MATTRENNANEDFVTIVSVGNNVVDNDLNNVNLTKNVQDVPFVTVLSIGQQGAEEEVTVYRLPGEKLGFGLKFEGGTKSAECVRRLFIQSCAPESPAGRARAAWGPLDAGDEILCIDRTPVTNLTRLECVRCLKDSNVAVKLLVRHCPEGKLMLNNENVRSSKETEHNGNENDKASLPPPVPPRKIPRKNSKDILHSDVSSMPNGNGRLISTLEINMMPNDSKKIDNQTKFSESITDNSQIRKIPLGKQSPGRPRRPPPVHSAPPPEAQVYTDLFCHEKENGIHIAESESDDTGSSISTVIDRLSAYSSFPGSVENSIPSTPTLGPKQFNLQVSAGKALEEIFLAEMPSRIMEHFNTKDAIKTNGKITTEAVHVNEPPSSISDHHNQTVQDEEVTVINNVPENNATVNTSEVKIEEPVKYNSSDANNNTNTIKIVGKLTEDCVDFVAARDVNSTSESKIIAIPEVPKPLPRNLNKKNVDYMLLVDFNRNGRPYDDNLSPTKLQNIETWLQEAIDCNIHSFEDADRQDYDREAVKPEVLPRLIDFVPKMQFNEKNQIELVTQTEAPVAEKKDAPEYSVKLSINVEKQPEISDETNSDWIYEGETSPQLETIGEDDEDSPTCPTLPIIKVTQQSPSGNINGEIIQFPMEPPKLPPPDIKPPEPVIIKSAPEVQPPMPIPEKESEECGVTVVVSRGARSPPDGRENPVTHQEAVPIFASIAPPKIPPPMQENFAKPKPSGDFATMKTPFSDQYLRSISYESPLKNKKLSTKTYGRGKDAKSEGSVKDKIAMFSSQKSVPAPQPERKLSSTTRPLDTRPQLPPTLNRFSYGDTLSKSYESLLDASTTKKKVEPPKSNREWSNGTTVKALELDVPVVNSYPKITYETIKTPEPEKISKDLKIPTFVARNIQTNTNNESHKSTIDYLIEQRRKSMTKLRGLVIPESSGISDLPEIKSRDSMRALTAPIIDKTSTLDRFPYKKPTTPSAPLTSLWDAQPLLNNVPKYSPAFKRKPLQLYATKSSTNSTSAPHSDDEHRVEKSVLNKTLPPSKPPRITLDNKRPFDQLDVVKKVSTLPSNFRGSSVTNNLNARKPKQDAFPSLDSVDNANLKILKSFSDAADSDNDSAVSSTQSSYLSTVSSPTPSLNTVDNTESDCSSQSTLSRDVNGTLKANNANKEKQERIYENGLNRSYLQSDEGKRKVCRSLSSDTSTSVGSSNSSTLTSGSQASCSSAGSSNTDTGSHRILKPRSIEAINRKNILASAKCRSGKDNKFGSPLIERKFSDDSTVESTDECDTSKKPHYISSATTNGNGERIKYNNIKNRSLSSGLADSVLKVAFTTLVEDKCSLNNDTDSSCSDTGSDSDGDADKPVKMTKKYASGSQADKSSEDSIRRASTENYVKATIEQAKVRRSISNQVENSRQPPPTTNGDKSASDVIVSESKSKKKESETNLCASEEDELDDQDQECFEVRLSRAGGGGVGVTLAGGVDCEAKELTIHKVLQGSAAERDGRLCKGDKVISINGHSMRGVTHAQAVAILKDPQPEVSIVVRGKQPATDVSNNYSSISNGSSTVISVELEKANAPGGAGLGISLQGGGNEPLLINKLFTGGAAARSGQIVSGSQLLAAGGTKLVGLTRTEAWGLLRALPPGPVTLVLRPP